MYTVKYNVDMLPVKLWELKHQFVFSSHSFWAFQTRISSSRLGRGDSHWNHQATYPSLLIQDMHKLCSEHGSSKFCSCLRELKFRRNIIWSHKFPPCMHNKKPGLLQEERAFLQNMHKLQKRLAAGQRWAESTKTVAELCPQDRRVGVVQPDKEKALRRP